MIALIVRAGLLLGFFLSWVVPASAADTFTCVGVYQSEQAALAACGAAAGDVSQCGAQGGSRCAAPAHWLSHCYIAGGEPGAWDYRCYGFYQPSGCPPPSVPDQNGQCSLPACGTQGTRFDTDYPHACEANPPEECPFGEIYHPVTGDCFMPPVCEDPEYLSVDQTHCIQPNCGAGKQYSSVLKKCVADPPTCGPGQHLVGSSFQSSPGY